MKTKLGLLVLGLMSYLPRIIYSAPCEVEAETTIRVFCNNVGIFPQQVVALYPDDLTEKKKEVMDDEVKRAEALAKVLLEYEEDPDLILLQEIWSIPARDGLIRVLADRYPYHVYPSNDDYPTPAGQASGLVTFSKMPLEDFSYKMFTRGMGADKIAKKGITGVRVRKDGKSIAIFNTHLQAGGKRDPSIKPDQLRECNAFIREFVDWTEGEGAIFAGDFNIHSTDAQAYGMIFNQIEGATDAYVDACSEIKGTTRSEKSPPEKRIDYILIMGPVRGISKIVDPTGPTLSDHIPIVGTFGLE